jgi:hypothetical protein
MLTVSENTYITIAEADELIATHLDKYNGLRLFWEILDDEEKEQYLTRSIDQMETLVYPGRKGCPMQPLTFPRAPSVEVPKEIKLAQAYNALGFLNLDIKEAGKETQKLYARFGVTFGPVDATNGVILNETQGVNRFTLESKKATQIVNKYVRGGFRMR